jgi:uncharacterized protein (UPF0332 family)
LAAEDALKLGHLETAANRIYYSIFYAVSALAVKYSFKTSKHSQLRGWFNKKFVYEDKKFSADLSAIYNKTFAYREKSDYDIVFKPKKDEVKKLFSASKKFIKEIKKELGINDKTTNKARQIKL